jgi:hypothetical protein
MEIGEVFEMSDRTDYYREYEKKRKPRKDHSGSRGFNGSRGKRTKRGKDKGKRSVKDLWEDNRQAKPFIGWDTEGYDDEYGQHHCMLLGSSHSTPLTGPSLSTDECLDYIVDVAKDNPDGIHIAYAFDYDVNMIIRDLPLTSLRILRDHGSCTYKSYTLSHIPNKMFVVRPDAREGVKRQWEVTIYDISSFFNKSKYLDALLQWKIEASPEVLESIEAGKKKRGKFTYNDVEYVRSYWQNEISLLPALADSMRKALYDAGFFITSWHGTGALASYMLAQNGVDKAMSKHNPKATPHSVQVAIRSAYAGGRFQLFQAGLWEKPVYTADLNSAYVTAARYMPDLSTGEWVRPNLFRVREMRQVPEFGLYRVSFQFAPQEDRAPTVQEFSQPFPFFWRGKNGGLSWPMMGEGWYWGPEVNAALASEKTRQGVTIEEAWMYRDDGSRPFAGWIDEAYRKRLLLQRIESPSEFAFKAGLAAMYGQMAQRVGWDRKKKLPPRKHQLEWAGFITSWCRAEMQKLAQSAGRAALVSIDTDGVTSLRPFRNLDVGDQLGQWKLKQFNGMLMWQNGIYWMRKGDEWAKPKSRGIPKAKTPRDRCMEALKELEADKTDEWKKCEFEYKHVTFVGYRKALQNRTISPLWHTWQKEPMISEFGGGGHVRRRCPKCQYQIPEILHQMTAENIPDPWEMSAPHRLPWLEPDKEYTYELIGALVFDIDNPGHVEMIREKDVY